MEESWRPFLPGIGVAFGAAAGVLAYTTTGDGLLVAFGAGLGVVVGATAAALLSTQRPAKNASA